MPAFTLIREGQLDNGVEHCLAHGCPTYLGRIYVLKGQFEDAIAVFESMPNPDRGYLGYAYAATGRRAKARDELRRAMDAQSFYADVDIAQIYVGLDQLDEAMTWIERMYRKREHAIVQDILDPIFEPLHGGSRFQALLKELQIDA